MVQKTIAFCLFKYFTHGGLQRDMLRIAQSCQQAGMGIRVYTMHWEGPQPDGFDVRIVPTRGWTNHGRAETFADQVRDLLKADPVSLVVGFNRMPGLDVYFGSDVCFAEELLHKNPLRRLTPRCRTYLKLEQAVVGPASKTHLLLISPTQIEDYRKHYDLLDSRFMLLPAARVRYWYSLPSGAEQRSSAPCQRPKKQPWPEKSYLFTLSTGNALISIQMQVPDSWEL